MSVQRMQYALLLTMSVGLVPVALSYGMVPRSSLPWLFGIEADGVTTRHVFRAIMGMYLGFVGLWALGALRPALRSPALWSLFVFTSGLAIGRLLSLIVDGWPGLLLFGYMLAEFAVAAACWWLIAQAQGGPDKSVTAGE